MKFKIIDLATLANELEQYNRAFVGDGEYAWAKNCTFTIKNNTLAICGKSSYTSSEIEYAREILNYALYLWKKLSDEQKQSLKRKK